LGFLGQIGHLHITGYITGLSLPVNLLDSPHG
jgi:hypothetical protein